MLGRFSWSFGVHFHIELEDDRCFEWSDPGYGGDDSITPAPPYIDWVQDKGIPYARDKGVHDVNAYTHNAFKRAGIC